MSNDYGTIINEFLDAAGKLVGVDVKEAFKDLIEDITIGYQKADGKHAAQDDDFDEVRDVLDKLGVDKPAPEAEPEPAGDLWEIAIRDTYNSVVEVRADKVQFGIIGLDSQDIGFTAYLDGSEVFHAPAGMYHYAKKVTE